MWRVPLLRLLWGNGVSWSAESYLKMFWVHWNSGWWFQIFLISPRTLGKWSNLMSIFQRGWSHQLVTYEVLFPFVFFWTGHDWMWMKCPYHLKSQDIFFVMRVVFYIIHFLKPTIFRCCVSFKEDCFRCFLFVSIFFTCNKTREMGYGSEGECRVVGYNWRQTWWFARFSILDFYVNDKYETILCVTLRISHVNPNKICVEIAGCYSLLRKMQKKVRYTHKN